MDYFGNLSVKARSRICEAIGHSRICEPETIGQAKSSHCCGRCGVPHSRSDLQKLIGVHTSGRLCHYCVQAYQNLRWHDWLFLKPWVVGATLSAMERATAENHYAL